MTLTDTTRTAVLAAARAAGEEAGRAYRDHGTTPRPPGGHLAGRGLIVRQYAVEWHHGFTDVAGAIAKGLLVLLTKADLAAKVHAALAEVYPADTLDWVTQAQWRYDEAVPLADIDMDRRPGGRDRKKVEGIAHAIADGMRMDPVVLVDTGDPHSLQIADGYHRTLAYRHAHETACAAYVASGVGEHGPWDREMHDRKLNKVGPKGYIHGWIFVGVPGVGDIVNHPQHGRGTVTSTSGGHVSVAFDSGAHHSFEAHTSEEHPATGHFQPRGHPADTVIMHRDHIPDMSTADLKAADEELGHRAEMLGKPGQVSKPHQAVKDELKRRDAQAHPRPSQPKPSPSTGELSQKDVEGLYRDYAQAQAAIDVTLDFRQAKPLWDRAEQAGEAIKAHGLPLFANSDDTPQGRDPALRAKAGQLMAEVRKGTEDRLPQMSTQLRTRAQIKASEGEDTILGYYEANGNQMTIGTHAMDGSHDHLIKKLGDTGFYTNGAGHNPAAYVIHHEYGHALDHQLSPATRDRMFTELATVMPQVSAYNPANDLESDWLAHNKAQVINGVSTYGASNDRELVAELWAESRTSPNPSAAAMIVNKFLSGKAT